MTYTHPVVPVPEVDLVGANNDPQGMAAYNNKLWVLDEGGTVYAYDTDGPRLTADDDFSVIVGNTPARGIAALNDKFWVVRDGSSGVIVYNADGTRSADDDFSIPSNFLAGITAYDGKLWVLYRTGSVSVHNTDGTQDTALGFSLSTPSTQLQDITAYDGKLWVLYATGGVRAYNTDGTRSADDDFVAGNFSRGIAALNDQFWVSNSSSDKIIAYNADGTRVSDDTTASSYVSLDLDAANSAPDGITALNDKFWVADGAGAKVYAYNADGTRSADDDFAVTTYPRGIAALNDKFWVVDIIDDKVFAYNADGTRSASDDFDLDTDNGSPNGITSYDDKLWVINGDENKVFAYNADGTRSASDDFDLDTDNGIPAGITVYNSKFWVADNSENKVFAYNTDGTRDAASDFDLHSDNENPAGITSYDNKFWVTNRADAKVYEYNADGTPVEIDTTPSPPVSRDFDLEAINTSPHGITGFNNRLYVTQASGQAKIFVHNLDGTYDSVFNLLDGNGNPRGITELNGKLWILDNSDDKIYVYNTDGTRDAASDFDLTIGISNPSGLTSLDGKLWVGDRNDRKIYAYNADGTRSADDDFDLHADNVGLGGITTYNNKFYVIEDQLFKIFVYNTDGTRDADSDFNLHVDNGQPTGIASLDDTLWVVDRSDDKVYAYNIDGTPAMTTTDDTDTDTDDTDTLDFDLDPANDDATGITFGDNKFWITDDDDEKIYSYTLDGTLITSFDLASNAFPTGIVFNNDKLWTLSLFGTPDIIVYNLDGSQDSVNSYELNSDNISPQGLAYGNDRFWVVDNTAGKIFAYDNDMTLDTSLSFDLHADNENPIGAVFAYNRLWVLSTNPKKVFVYFAADGTRDTASDFDLGDNLLGSHQPSGITIANDALYVTATLSNPASTRVFAYTQEGDFFRDIAATAALAISSAITISKATARAISGTMSISDNITKSAVLTRAIAVAATISDQLSKLGVYTKNIPSALSISAAAMTGPFTFTRNIMNSLNIISDAPAKTAHYTRHIFYEKNHISNERQFSKDTSINDTDNFLGLEAIDTGTGIILITNAVDNAGGALSFDYNPTQSPNLANESTHVLNVGVIRANAIYRNGPTTKLLIHNNTDDHFYDYDYDIATKTTSNEADLGLFAHTMRGMAIQNQKLIIVDTSANPSVLYDYDYDPTLPAATRLSNQRLITGVALLNNVRVMAANNGGIYTARNNSSVINHYEYDEENGTIANNTEIINSANNSPIRPTGLAIVRNKLIWLDRNRVFYDYDLSTPALSFSSVVSRMQNVTSNIINALSVSNLAPTATKRSSIIRNLVDTISIAVSTTKSVILTRAIAAATISISDVISTGSMRFFSRALSDALNIATTSFSKSGTYMRSLAAAATISDQLSKLGEFVRTITPNTISITTQNTAVKAIAPVRRAVSSALSISAALTKSTRLTRRITDAVLHISDVLSRPLHYTRDIIYGGNTLSNERVLTTSGDVITSNDFRGLSAITPTVAIEGSTDPILVTQISEGVLYSAFGVRYSANDGTIHDQLDSTGPLSGGSTIRANAIYRDGDNTKLLIWEETNNHIYQYDYNLDTAPGATSNEQDLGAITNRVRGMAFGNSRLVTADDGQNPAKLYDYVYDPVAGTVGEEREITPAAGITLPNRIGAMDVDNGRIYIAVRNSNVIRYYDYNEEAGTISNETTMTGVAVPLPKPLGIVIIGSKLIVLHDDRIFYDYDISRPLNISTMFSAGTQKIKNLVDTISIAASMSKLAVLTRAIAAATINITDSVSRGGMRFVNFMPTIQISTTLAKSGGVFSRAIAATTISISAALSRSEIYKVSIAATMLRITDAVTGLFAVRVPLKNIGTAQLLISTKTEYITLENTGKDYVVVQKC